MSRAINKLDVSCNLAHFLHLTQKVAAVQDKCLGMGGLAQCKHKVLQPFCRTIFPTILK